jgi:hypothetical protein
MSSGHAEPSRRRLRSVLDALFGEAWQLERRRRRWLLFLCCLTAASVGVALALIPGSTKPTGATGQSSRVTVASHRLPLSTDFTGLSAVHGQLILTAYGNSPVGAVNGGSCSTAVVNSQNLNLGPITRGACDDPALFHRRVMEVDQYDRGVIHVRIAAVDPNVARGYSLGPVLFSYQQCSDCWDVSTYGPRSLWVFTPDSTPNFKGPSELFRISEQTGRVLRHWAMPKMERPLLATDQDGLWIAPSIDGGGPSALYHVTPNSRGPTRALQYGTRSNAGMPARFVIASQHTVWLMTFSGIRNSRARLWRLDNTKIVEHGRTLTGGEDCADSGEGPPTVLGNPNTGFDCVAIGKWVNGRGATTQNVFRVLPALRSEQRVATVRPPVETADVQAAAALGDSYYFLDPRTQTQGQTDEFYGSKKQAIPTYTHAAKLIRVTAS